MLSAPMFTSWDKNNHAAALIGDDDFFVYTMTMGHEMNFTLRPGEKLTHRWDNVGKMVGRGALKYYANSFLEYDPVLDQSCLESTYEHKSIKAGGNFVGITPEAFVTFMVESPYVICGGALSGTFYCGMQNDKITIAVSLDGENWTDVWQQTGNDYGYCDIEFDDVLGVHTQRPCHGYFVRISLASKKEFTRVDDLKIRTALQNYPVALPRLSLGKNEVKYTDETKGPRSVEITHSWQESSNIKPPSRPKLIYPDNKAVSKDDWIEFTWNEVKNADKYHLRVSKRPDMKTAYRPCYDIMVDETSFCNSRTGLFNPDETYYWRVRARNTDGVWGDWSPVRTFSWSGPRPPIELASFSRDGKIYLTWQPNPLGNTPVGYEVYASDIKGFKPSKKSHEVHALGEMPSNLVGQTNENRIIIVSPDPNDNAPNKSSYRVIAIDENGTPGGSSWPLELDHPLIYSKPVQTVKAGNKYEYKVLTLQSMGDLQYRAYTGDKSGLGYWEREGYQFYLGNGPKWLTIDSDTGIISGVPGKGDAGEFPVTVRVNRTYPYEVTKQDVLSGDEESDDNRPESSMKTGPEFPVSDEQMFVLKVIR